MTKNQKISAIKKLIKFVESDEFGMKYVGLCPSTRWLWLSNKIDNRVYDFLMELINTHPAYNDPIRLFYWKAGSKKPRINWLNKQIKLIEEGKI